MSTEDPFDEDAVTPVANVPHQNRQAVRPPPLPGAPLDLTPLSPLQRQKAFGRFEWRPDPMEGNRERIRILGDWVSKNIVFVEVPQLEKIGVYPKIRFHRLGVKQLLAMFAAWDAAGLLGKIKTWNGSFVTRMKRGKAGGGLADLSNHAFGSAVDINASWNRLGEEPARIGQPGCVRELVPIANANGFVWGGAFSSRPDGMHFELCRLDANAGAG